MLLKQFILLCIFSLTASCVSTNIKEEEHEQNQFNIGLEAIRLHNLMNINPIEIRWRVAGEFEDEHKMLTDLYREIYLWSDEKYVNIESEKLELEKIIRTISKFPILQIKTLSSKRAVIVVGEVKGPLNAKGETFYLIKHDSRWIVVVRTFWVS